MSMRRQHSAQPGYYALIYTRIELNIKFQVNELAIRKNYQLYLHNLILYNNILKALLT